MLSYRIHGRGRPLLLIHGWGVTYSVWRRLIPLLAREFQVILVELPGLGASAAEMPAESYYEACAESLEALRESLGVARWSLLSYSVGTLVAEAYLRNYPQRVERAAFICPIHIGRFWRLALRAARWIDARNARLLIWILMGWRLRVLVWMIGFNFQWSPGLAEWSKEIALQPVYHLKRILLEAPGEGCAPYLSATTLQTPELFVWGQRDLMCVTPPPTGPHDVYLPINHAAPESAPRAVAAVVLPFLTAREPGQMEGVDAPAGLDELWQAPDDTLEELG